MSEAPNNQADDQSFKSKWPGYYEAVAGLPPRDTLLAALARFETEETAHSPRFAVDLGCGEGRGTVELLRSLVPWRS